VHFKIQRVLTAGRNVGDTATQTDKPGTVAKPWQGGHSDSFRVFEPPEGGTFQEKS
jgi:hypothetical protein